MSEHQEFYEAEEEPIYSVVLGTGINQATNRRETVTVGDVERRGGIYMLGQPRTGKTSLLVHSLILQDMKHGHGLCFIDPHGDGIEDVLKLVPENRLDDVILLDPLDEEYAFGLNLFACKNPQSRKQISRTINYVLQVFGKLFTESGDLQDAVTMYGTLLNTTILLVYNALYTLAEVNLILVNRDAAAKLIERIGEAHDDQKEWWLAYNRMKFAEKEEVSGSTQRRLQPFLADEHIRHIVGQSKSTLDFRRIMDTGKILLVKLPREFPELSKLVGSLIIGQLLTAAYSRDDTPEPDRRQFCLYCDEFQNFATPDFAELFTQTGKYHIAPTVAHQERVGQFAEEKKILGATSAAAIKISFQTTVKDADELAPEYARPPEEAWEEELEEEWVEIVTPQRHERVEEQVEVEVEEDVRGLPVNPIEYLASPAHTHPSAVVRELIGKLIVPIREAAQPEHMMQWHSKKIERVHEQINHLLIAIMEEKISPHSEQLVNAVQEIVDGYNFIVRVIGVQWGAIPIPDMESYLLQLCEELAKEPILVPTGKKRLVKRIQPHITYLTHESEKITHPRKTISHPKRTEADMVGRMRRELINLPRFTAWCKIVKAVAGKQVVVKYTLYPDPPESVMDGAGSPDWKRAYIVARMHDETFGYYRKRETVEQEIAARRATLKAREPRQKGQTTSDEEED